MLVEVWFIETALACAMGRAQLKDAYPLLAAMLLIIVWKRMGWNLGRIPAERLRISVEYQTKLEVTKKRSKLKYSDVEDNKIWELCQRVGKEMHRNMSWVLSSICDFLMSMIRIFGVLLIIFAENPVLGGIMILIMVPLVTLSVKSGKHIYTAFQEAAEHERRGEYLQNVLTGRDTADERTFFAYTEYVNEQWNEELMETDGLYRQMYDSQKSWYSDGKKD